jgi:glycosyl transferase, family 25
MSSAPVVYVINLDRCADRLAAIGQKCGEAGLHLERIAAIDCRELEQIPWRAQYDEARNRREYLGPLTPGEIACFLSHRRAWGAFLQTNDPAAVFLEDDVIPLAGADEIDRVMQQVADFPGPLLCKMNTLHGARQTGRTTRLRRSLLPPLTGAAHGMNRAAAEKLLSFTATFHEPVDVCLQRWWDHGVDVRIADPPLFEEKRGAGYASTIRPPGEGPPEGRLQRELRRPFFQLRRLARALSASVSGPRL